MDLATAESRLREEKEKLHDAYSKELRLCRRSFQASEAYGRYRGMCDALKVVAELRRQNGKVF